MTDQTAQPAIVTSDKGQGTSVFAEWLAKLKAEGKSDEAIGQMLAGVAKLSALDVYAALMTTLTEDDMKEVEGISDDEQAKKRMEELFQQRSGMTVDEVVKKAQEGFVEGYKDTRLEG